MLLSPHPRAGHQYCAREAASPPPPHHPLPTHHPMPELQDGPTAPIGAGTRGVGDVLGEAKPVATSRLVQQENCSGLKLGDRLAFWGLGKASTEGKRAFSPRFGLSELLVVTCWERKTKPSSKPRRSHRKGDDADVASCALPCRWPWGNPHTRGCPRSIAPVRAGSLSSRYRGEKGNFGLTLTPPHPRNKRGDQGRHLPLGKRSAQRLRSIRALGTPWAASIRGAAFCP